MDKEQIQLQNRFRELADKSYTQNVYTFTGFLNLAEQDVFLQTVKEFDHVSYRLSGPEALCERKMARFGCLEDLGYEEEFPIACIHIQPLLKKFAEELSHRDFLGALMNLGIERSTLGDIFVTDKEAYLFCQKSMAEFICEKLDKVRHTNVRCRLVESTEELSVREPEAVELTASSERADGVIAKLYHLSREKSQSLFAEKKVYIDGRLTENLSRNLKAGELVTVRGFGRFLYEGVKYETKKGKLCIMAKRYR